MGSVENDVFAFDRKFFQDWRDGSAVTSTGCTSRGPELNSCHLRGSSVDLTPSLASLGTASMWCTDIHTNKTHPTYFLILKK